MKKPLLFLFLLLLACSPASVFLVSGDTLVLLGDRPVGGTVLRTNGDDLLFLTDYGTQNYLRSIVTKIKLEQAEVADIASTTRLPTAKNLILYLNKQPWASTLQQIPATVIDKGTLKNVPYISFKCGDDYEVNIYGELNRPAGIEMGVYRKLLDSASAKANCLKFITALLGESADKEIIKSLNLEKDMKSRDGLTFEITPPTAEDAYMGWWVSVYSEQKLNLSRASDDEMAQLSVSKADAGRNKENPAWSPEELKQARASQGPPKTITFTDKSGTTLTNVQVVRVIDGVSLLWRDGASGGMVKLADLPQDLRTAFGYDAAKSAAANQAEEDRKAREWQAQVRAAQLAQQTQSAASDTSAYTGGGDYSYSPSTGGRVYVRGYIRSNGTYVNSYTRSAPHRH